MEGPGATNKTTNSQRAHLGRGAIDAFMNKIEGEKADLEDTVTDLIADLLHYAREKQLDPSRVAQRAWRLWRAEDRDPNGDGTRVRKPKMAFKQALWALLAILGAVSVALLIFDEAMEQLPVFGYMH